MSEARGETETNPMDVREDFATNTVLLVCQADGLASMMSSCTPPSTQTWALTTLLAAGDLRLVKNKR